jgi:hypothetical protein
MEQNINIWIVLLILLLHWVADFVLQTDEQAKGKSKKWSYLLRHTFNYSIFVSCAVFGWSMNTICFFVITLICHTWQDYFTSRLNAKLWAANKNHLFFVSIGLDQFLHFMQLLITYQFLISNK